MPTATAASEIAPPPHPRDELKSLALEADQFYASDDWKNADAPTRQKYLDRTAEVFDEAFTSAESSLDAAEADSFYNSTTAFLQGKMAEHNSRDADEKRRRAAADKSMQVFTERQKVTPEQVSGVVRQSLEVAGGMSAQTRGSGVMKMDGEQGKPSIGVQPLDWTPSAEEFWKSHYDLTASEAEKKSAKDFARSKGKDSLADDLLYRSAVAGEESAKLAARDLAFSKGADAAGVAAAEQEATSAYRRNAKLAALESTQSSDRNPKGRKLPFRVVRTNGMLNIEPEEGKAEEAMLAAERMGLLTSEEAARLIPSGVEMDKEFASRPKAQGGLVTAVKEFGSAILPALGTAAGTAIGAAASKGDVSTAMVGGASGGSAALWLQNKVFGQVDQAQREANARAHPGWAQVGSFVPFLVSMFQKTPPALTTVGKMAQAAKVSLEPGTAAARWESALQSGVAMGRAGFSSGVQQRYVEGNKDVNPIDEGVRSFIAGGAMGILKPAKGILMAMTGKAVKDAAAVTFAEGLYDLAVHNKPIDFKAIADEAPGTFTAFALQNAVMGVFHKFQHRREMAKMAGKSAAAANTAAAEAAEAQAKRFRKDGFIESAIASEALAETHRRAAKQDEKAATEQYWKDVAKADEAAPQKLPKPPESSVPAPHPVIVMIDSAVAAHANELAALGHPSQLTLVTMPEGDTGLRYNPNTGRIEYDPVALERQAARMAPRQQAEWIKRAVSEEVFHAATDKYASESPENRAKLYDILKDKDAVAAAEEAYGKEAFDGLDTNQKAFEVARVLLQGPRRLTEAAYRFFKGLLRWLDQKLKNLSPNTKELLDGIKTKLEAHESGKAEKAKTAEHTQANEGPLTERAAYGRTGDVYDAFGNVQRKVGEPKNEKAQSVPSVQKADEPVRLPQKEVAPAAPSPEPATPAAAKPPEQAIADAIADANWLGTVREVPAPRSMGGEGVKLYIPVDASGKDVSVGGQTILGKTPAEAIELAQKNTKPAPAPQAPAAGVKEQIDRILKMAEQPMPKIVESVELLYNDGKWRSPVGGAPAGVSAVNPVQRRIAGYVIQNPEGTTGGVRLKTREEQEQRQRERIERTSAEFRKALEEMTPEQLASQEKYWTDEKAKRERLAAPLPSQKKPVAEDSDAAKLRDLQKVRYKTAAQEKNIEILKARVAADPSKWKVGDGISYKVNSGGVGSQTNRGFRIVRINPESKLALVRSVADTGLTSSGGDADRIGDQWIHVAELKRDKKYDAPAPAPQAPAPGMKEAVFTREEIDVSKPRISRRKRPDGTDGKSVTEISAPSSVTNPDNWNRLGDTNKLSATVEARLDFASGKTPKKTDQAWTAYGGRRTERNRPILARGVTYEQAIEAAKDHVESANTKPTPAPQTPLQRDWTALKAQAPDSLVAVRLGDFYEFFNDDAVVSAKAMGVALTKRNGVAMSGIPLQAAEGYFKKLTDAGHKVAIADMVDGKRAITETRTPAPALAPPAAAEVGILPKSNPLRRGDTIEVLSGPYKGMRKVEGYEMSEGGEVYVRDEKTGMDVPVGANNWKLAPAPVTETAADIAKREEREAAEQVAKEAKDAAEAKAKQDKEQGNLFDEDPFAITDSAPTTSLPVASVQRAVRVVAERLAGAMPHEVISDGSQYPERLKYAMRQLMAAKKWKEINALGRAEILKEEGIPKEYASYAWSGLPESVRDALIERQSPPTTEDMNRLRGAVSEGKIYINAAAIEKPREAIEVFMHEAAGHGGTDMLLKAFGEKATTQLDAMLKRLFEAEYAAVKRRYEPQNQVRETLAMIMEGVGPEMSAQHRTRWQRVVDWLRNALNKLGVKQWSTNDVMALLRRGVDAVRKQRARATDVNTLSGSELTYAAREAGVVLTPKETMYVINRDPAVTADVRARVSEARGDGPKMSADNDQSKPFYSALTKTVQALPQETMTAQQARAAIEKGAKKDEIAMSGILTDPLSPLVGKQPGDKVTKAELTSYALERQATVQDVVLGNDDGMIFKEGYETKEALMDAVITDSEIIAKDGTLQKGLEAVETDSGWNILDARAVGGGTHFASYQLPGADEGSYREMFVTWPWGQGAEKVNTSKWTTKTETPVPSVYNPNPTPIIRVFDEHGAVIARFEEKEARDEQDAIRQTAADLVKRRNDNWRDGHAKYSDIANPIVRIRRNIRTDAEGRKTYFIEEIQGPGKGEQEKMPPELRKRIYEIGVKRALRDAVDEGADAIAWTTGEQQAERYDLSKQVEKLSAKKNADGSFDIRILPTDGTIPRDIEVESESKLVDTVGKELAEKISKQEVGMRPEYSGDNLKVGGEGLKRVYDQMLPAIANDLAKKFGVKAGRAEVGTPTKPTFEVLDADGVSIAGPFITRAEAEREIGKYGGVKVQQISGAAAVHSLPIPEALKTQQRGGNVLFSLKDENPATDSRANAHIIQHKSIPVEMIDRDQDYLNPDIVSRYEDAIRRGQSIDPPLLMVNPKTGRFTSVDGHHRIQAYKNLGITNIAAAERAMPPGQKYEIEQGLSIVSDEDTGNLRFRSGAESMGARQGNVPDRTGAGSESSEGEQAGSRRAKSDYRKDRQTWRARPIGVDSFATASDYIQWVQGGRLIDRAGNPIRPDTSDIRFSLKDENPEATSTTKKAVMDKAREVAMLQGSADKLLQDIRKSGRPPTVEEMQQIAAIDSLIAKRQAEIQAEASNVAQGATKDGTQGGIAGTGTLQPYPASNAPIVPIKPMSEIIRDIAKGIGIPIRFGRLTTSKFAGYFKKLQNLIGAKSANDIAIVSHEVGHKLDDMFGFSKYPKIAAELNALGDPATPGSRSSWTKSKSRSYKMGEGVAEFVRHWITDPAKAKADAPLTNNYFEQIMDANPDFGDVMKQAREDVQNWRNAPSEARLDSSISVGSNPNKTKYRLSQLTRDLVDDLHILRLAFDDLKKITGKDVAPSDNGYLLARLLRGSYGMADTFIRHGTVDFKTRAVTLGNSFTDALKPVAGRINEFRRWIVAKRAVELHSQGRETGLVAADVDAVAQKYAAEPGFQDAFDKLKAWNDSLLQYAVDSGYVSQESAASMQAMNQDYVPFHRIFEIGAGESPSQESSGTGRGLNVGKAGSLKRLKGSKRDIVDPLETMIKNAYVFITASEKAAINSAIANLSKTEGMGKWVEEIATPKESVRVELAKVRDELEAAGADLDSVPDDLVMQFFQNSGRVPFGENIIKVTSEGETKFYRLKSELFDAFHALDLDDSSKLIQILSQPAQVLRAGVTIAPDFALSNVIRDAVGSAVINRYGMLPFEASVRGVAAIFKNPQLVAEWAAAGGEQSFEASFFDRKKMAAFMRERITKDMTKGEQAMVILKSPLTALRYIGGLAESATRIGEFERAYKEAIKGGMSEGDARRQASFESRDRQDFSKGGAKTKILRHMAAFWNAGLQGNIAVAQAFKERPIRTTLQGLAFITLPTMLLMAINHDDKDYWDRPQWERDAFWLIPIGRDNNKATQFLRIPKPFILGLAFGALPERVMAFSMKKDPEPFKDIAGTMLREVVPNPIPQTAQVLIADVLTGKQGWDIWRGRPVVPDSLAELPSEMQWTEQTSLTARKIGAMIPRFFGGPWSPMKVDHFIAGTTGGLGRQVVHNAIDRAIGAATGETPTATRVVPGARFLTVPAGISSQAVTDFYDNITVLREKKNAIKMGRGMSAADRNKLAAMEFAAKQIAGLRKQAHKVKSVDEKQVFYLRIRDIAMKHR
jgi:hypothetical protein